MDEISNSTSLAGLPSVVSEDKFFRRQFNDEPTLLQGIFDWLFGIILPPLCFYFDPIFFRISIDPKIGKGINQGLFSDYSILIYAIAAVAITGLLVWKLLGHRSKVATGFLGILFYVSAIIAFALGVIMIPFSILGLTVYFVGILGFIPFLSAFVYLRNGKRAMRFAGEI